MIAASAASAAPQGEADYSGLAPFWAIAEAYAAGGEPTEDAWAALFATPGYATLVERENADRFLARLLPLALSPGKELELREAVAEQPALEMFVEHLRSAYQRRDELAAFEKELAERPLLEEALGAAQAWLPPGSASRLPAPAISFVIYQPDARGYDRIVMDLLLAFELPESFEALLAHETHHVLRGEMQPERNHGDRPERRLLTTLDNLQAEGVADLIDKPGVLEKSDWGESSTGKAFGMLMTRFRTELDHVHERLAEVDRILATYAADPSAAEELGNRLRDVLIMGGHPVGFHMATAIVAAGERDRLVERVADPLDFVRAYHEAGSREGDPHHVFSAEALRGLASLESVAE